jgi:hypothetical protein
MIGYDVSERRKARENGMEKTLRPDGTPRLFYESYDLITGGGTFVLECHREMGPSKLYTVTIRANGPSSSAVAHMSFGFGDGEVSVGSILHGMDLQRTLELYRILSV